MILSQYGNVIVCGPGEQRVAVDRKDGEQRWCFTCRKRREFRFVVTEAVDWENDWYGPTPSVRCATCNTTDGDCFPGRYRTWGDN